MILEPVIIVATVASAAVGARALALLKRLAGRRMEPDDAAHAKETEIEEKIAQSSGTTVIPDVIDSLGEVQNAVVIVGDVAIVKDLVAGKPHISVKNLSSHQHELIAKGEAPLKDAKAFEAWLGESSIVS